MRFEPTPNDTTVSQTNAIPTELTRSALSEGILYYFNDQLGEAWPVQTRARIDEITSIQRALNISERPLSRYQLSSRGAGKARFNVATPTYAPVTCTAYVLLIIYKQNPFNIISRGVQGCTSTDFRLK